MARKWSMSMSSARFRGSPAGRCTAFPIPGRNCYACGMTQPKLLLAGAAAALAASPLAARPMTATDLQSMHRLGSPDVSRDGHYAVFTVSTTDWSKNKRVNTLTLLDLSRPGAQPQPIPGASKGHDA